MLLMISGAFLAVSGILFVCIFTMDQQKTSTFLRFNGLLGGV